MLDRVRRLFLPSLLHPLVTTRGRATTRPEPVHWWVDDRPLIGMALLSIGLVLAVACVRLPAWSTDIDAGAEGPFLAAGQARSFQNYFTFQASERWQQRSFRWTGARAAVTFPSAGQMQPLILDLVMCGCRPNAAAVAVPLRINDTDLANLTLTGSWRQYRMLLPADRRHPDHSVVVELLPPAWTDGSGRTLGVAVDRIRIRQAAPAAPGTPFEIAFVTSGMLALVLVCRSLRLPALLGGAWLIMRVLYTPQLLSHAALTVVLAVGLIGLWAIAHRPWAQVYATLAGLWLMLAPSWLGRWMVDDAYISFRYARNLLDGAGLVFNRGEVVEGYTNFLWTLAIAAGMAIGFDPVLFTNIATQLLAFAIIVLAVLLARRLVGEVWAWATATLIALSTPLLLYTSRGSGMETACFAALALATLLALLQRRWIAAGFLAALTLLTRPDGAVLAGLGGGYAAWCGWQLRRNRVGTAWVRPLLRYGVSLLGLYAPYFVWRASFYGQLLPNTFYVKVGASSQQVLRGLSYLWTFGSDGFLLWFGLGGLAVGLAALHARRQPIPPDVWLPGGFAILWSVYLILVGGDWMPGYRFGVPLVAPLALIGTWGLDMQAGSRRWRAVTAWGIVAAMALGLTARLPADSTFNPDSGVWREMQMTMQQREIGRWIEQHTNPDTRIAVAAAGALPYYAGRPTVDVLGLNDIYIAHLSTATRGMGKPGHEQTDAAYVLARAPDLIAMSAKPYLRAHPAFEQTYRLRTIDGPDGRRIQLYVRAGRESVLR